MFCSFLFSAEWRRDRLTQTITQMLPKSAFKNLPTVECVVKLSFPPKGGGEGKLDDNIYIVFNIHIELQIVVMETMFFCEIVHCQPEPCFPFKCVLQYQYPAVSPEHSREVHLIPDDKFHLVVCTILRQNLFACLPQYSVLMCCLPRWELGLNNGSHWYKNLQYNASQWTLHLSVFILSTLDSMIFSYYTSSTTLQLWTAVRWDNPHTTHTQMKIKPGFKVRFSSGSFISLHMLYIFHILHSQRVQLWDRKKYQTMPWPKFCSWSTFDIILY